MGTKIYGIGASEAVDRAQERLLIQGLDTSRLRGIKDEHDEDSMFRKIGAVTFHKKIFSDKDCENEYQLKCWKFARVPFPYAEAELADSDSHPDAQAAAALLRFTSRPEVPMKLGFSVDGGTLERSGPDEKTLSRTIATDLALTSKPANETCRVWLFNDLTKSELASTMPAPAIYFERLAKSRSARSIVENPLVKLYFLTDRLYKSLSDFQGGFTSMKCWHCGEGIRFFKSSRDVPPNCPKCGHSFSLGELWSAFNK